MTPTEAALALGGKELFKHLVTDVYGFIVKQTSRKLKQWNTERKIDGLYRKIGQVRKVKTIWQVDKAVDLTEFYCDSHVVVGRERKSIHQLSDLGGENLLIQGIAGQGKSIFLRYLCSVELALGNHIPLFLELRRISKNYSLRDRIYMAFKSLGLTVDDELFEALAESGRVLLLLDAFDEVPDDLKGAVLTDIEDLVTANENLRVIVTSRPNNNIQMSSHVSVVTLDNLQGDEYAAVIQKLAGGARWADSLTQHIERHATHMREMLCTPLMVTLLVLSYKSYQKLPSKMSDFYDALFQTLLQRHDGTKPGFTRERACALDDGQYRQVFETLCILAKKEKEQSYSYETIHRLAKAALSQCSLTAEPKYYVSDIVKITCLILRDGVEHRFIHKTVQEYYTAAYIEKQPETWAAAFYGKVFSQNAHREWQQELEFLSEIDTHRYNRYYLLPTILAFLGIQASDLAGRRPRLTQAKLRKILKPLNVEIRNQPSDMMRFILFDSPHFLASRVMRVVIEMAHDHEEVSHRLLKVDTAKSSRTSRAPIKVRERSLQNFTESLEPFVRMMDVAGVTAIVTKAADKEFERIFEQAKKIEEELRVAESPALLDGLI